MLILSATDVMAVMDAGAVTAAVATAFREVSGGTAQVPPRTKLPLADTENRLIVMSAFLPESAALATKIVTHFPGNPTRSMPLILGVIVLLDDQTGIPLAILDGASATCLRTAAGSAVATQALAPPTTSTLAIIGAGPQAEAHLRLFASLFELHDVRICARSTVSAQRLANEAASWIVGQIRAVATPEEAIRGADIVVAATTATEPIVLFEWLNASAHVCGVGAVRPGIRELDSEVLRNAAVVAVDTRSGALEEAGDIMTPISDGVLAPERISEIGEILLGKRPGREHADVITVYKSVGTAAMDASVAAAVYGAARLRGLGTDVPINGWS